MSSLVAAFRDGGVWMYIIVLWAGAFYGLLTVQYLGWRTRDMTWILWGLLASLALLGPLGSAVGLHQAGLAIGGMRDAGAAEAVRILSSALGIAVTTTIFSTLLSVIGAVLLGIVTHRVRGRSAGGESGCIAAAGSVQTAHGR